MTTTPISARASIRVGVLSDTDLVRHGVRAMLEPFARRVRVVDLDDADQRVDVALLDAWSRRVVDRGALRAASTDPHIGRVVLYTTRDEPDPRPDTADQPCLSKQLGGADLLEALEGLTPESVAPGTDAPPGDAEGLTPRQAEMITLIATGLTNREIVETTGLSANTVKSYIRTAYWRMGVTTRSRAVRWAMEHGYVRPELAPTG